nr:kelch repeat-containing protein [uncultured Flavobacterium sp.]
MRKQLHNKQWLLYVCLSVFTLSQTLLAQTTATFSRRAMLGNQFSSRLGAGMVTYGNDIYIYGGNSNSANPQDMIKYNVTTGAFTKMNRIVSGVGNPKGKAFYKVGDFFYHFDPYGTGVSKYNPATDTWQENIAPYSASSPESGFVIGTTVYITSALNNTFWAFDTATNTWTQKANFPGSAVRLGTFAFELNGKGYVGGGRESGCVSPTTCFVSAFFEYNPATDTWTQKAFYPIGVTGATAVSVNGKAYVGLGECHNAQFNINSVLWYEYDATADAWTAKQNFMQYTDGLAGYWDAVNQAKAVAIGSDVYVFGGTTASYISTFTKDDLYKYNTVTDQWTEVSDETGGNRTLAFSVYSGGKIYAGGGVNGEILNDFHVYDPATNAWVRKADLPERYYNRGAAAIGNKIYTIGGYNAQYGGINANNSIYIKGVFEYDTTTEQWATKTEFPGTARGSMATVTYNGNIYTGFGFNGAAVMLNDFYRYNPTTDTWTQMASAPFVGGGNLQHYMSGFVIGDFAYFIKNNYMGPTARIIRYSFANNTWTEINVNIEDIFTINHTSVAFAFNGKGYIVVNNSSGYAQRLLEYNPADNTTQYVATLPFRSLNQSITATEDGAYFAFGESVYDGGEDTTVGMPQTNQLWKLKINAEISTATGTFAPETNLQVCATALMANHQRNITDTEGKIIASVKSTFGISGLCIEANSVPLTPYRTTIGTFQQHPQQAMFANKSVLTKSGEITIDSSLRIYFTTNELASFVNAFNTQFNANKSIADIKIISQYDYNNPELADHNPLNNLFAPPTNPTGRLYKIHTTTMGDYLGGKYFEATSISGAGVHKEIYVVLMSDPMPTAAPQATAQSFCGSATVANLTATGENLKWYSAQTGGYLLESAALLSTGNYYVSQTLYGSEGPRTEVSVTITNPQAPQGQATQSLNGNVATDVTIEDIVISGSNIKWYASPAAVAAGTPLPDGTQLANGVTYYATQTINGCESAAFAVTVSVTLSVSGNDKVHFDYYPNPVHNQLNIVSGEPVTAVVVYNMLGSKVLEQKFNATTVVIDMSSLQQGSYLVRVSTNDGQRSVLTIKK